MLVGAETDHNQTVVSQYLTDHISELRDDFDLGTIGMEQPPFMNVFLWAYEDRNKGIKLPVPKEKMAQYVRTMYECNVHHQKLGMEAKANLAMAAIDHGVEVVDFDTRQLLEWRLNAAKKVIPWLERAFAQHGSLFSREQMRLNSKLVERMQEVVTRNAAMGFPLDETSCNRDHPAPLLNSFVTMEAKALLDANPQYQRRLENLEAVAEAAQRTYPYRGGQVQTQDAFSAALLVYAAKPGHNILSISGSGHIKGFIAPKDPAVQGTFSRHIRRMGLPGMTALLTTEKDFASQLAWRERYFELTDKKPWVEQFRRQGHPGLITPAVAIFDGKLSEQQRARWREFTDTYLPVPSGPSSEIFGAQYMGMMQREIEKPEMQAKLAKLRER